jgi:hypothetical protein
MPQQFQNNASPYGVRVVRQMPSDDLYTDEDTQRRREIEQATLKDLKLGNITKFIGAMNLLRPDWVVENPSLCAQTEEMLNSAMHSSNAPLPISAVASDLGIVLQHEQLIKVGAAVARLYREKYHTEPPKKASQHGDERRVNAYTEADRHLIATALTQFFSD